MDELVDFQVEDHVYNCRFCFRPFTDERKSIEITETIELKFFELTQFQLVQGEAFSSVICISCENELDGFIKYRHNMLEKQKRLHEALLQQDSAEVKEEFELIMIKSEVQEDDLLVEEECFSNETEQKSLRKIVKGSVEKKRRPTRDKHQQKQEDDDKVGRQQRAKTNAERSRIWRERHLQLNKARKKEYSKNYHQRLRETASPETLLRIRLKNAERKRIYRARKKQLQSMDTTPTFRPQTRGKLLKRVRAALSGSKELNTSILESLIDENVL